MRPVVVVVVAVVVAIAFLSLHPVASDPVPMKPSMVAGAYESLRKKSVGPPHRKTDGALDNSQLGINGKGHKKALPSGNPLRPKPRLTTRPGSVTVTPSLPKKSGPCGSRQFLSKFNGGICIPCYPAGIACKEPGCCCPGSKKMNDMCIGISCREGDKNCTKCEKDINCFSECCTTPEKESVAVCMALEVCKRQRSKKCDNNTIRCTNSAKSSLPPVHPSPRPHSQVCKDYGSKVLKVKERNCCKSDGDCDKLPNHCCCKGECVPCKQKSKMHCLECEVDTDCDSGYCCSPKNKCRKCSKMECTRVFNSSDLITLVTFNMKNTCDEINSYDGKCVFWTGRKLICQMRKDKRKCLFPPCPAECPDKKYAGCCASQNCPKGECCRIIENSAHESNEVCVPCASPAAPQGEGEGRVWDPECMTNGDCEENKCCKKGVCSTCENERDVDVPTAKSGDGCIVGRDCPPHACCAKRDNEKDVCRKCGKESKKLVRCNRDSDCAGGECCFPFGLGLFCTACPTPPAPVHPTYASCKTNRDCSPNSCCTRMSSSPTKKCLPRPQTGNMCIVESSRFARFSCPCEGKHVQCVSSATKQRADVGTCELRVPEKPREGKTKETRDARNKKQKPKSSRRKNDRKSKKSN